MIREIVQADVSLQYHAQSRSKERWDVDIVPLWQSQNSTVLELHSMRCSWSLHKVLGGTARSWVSRLLVICEKGYSNHRNYIRASGTLLALKPMVP